MRPSLFVLQVGHCELKLELHRILPDVDFYFHLNSGRLKLHRKLSERICSCSLCYYRIWMIKKDLEARRCRTMATATRDAVEVGGGDQKIKIRKIDDLPVKQVTFLKRRRGLLKKAGELSFLCDCEYAVTIFSATGKLFESSSSRCGMNLVDARYLHGRPL